MSKNTKTGRLYIDEKAIQNLNEMMGALAKESPHLNMSPSKVASLILSEYRKKYFLREKKGLSEKLFDERRYIKHLLSTEKSPDELIRQVSELRGVRSRKGRNQASMLLEEPLSSPSKEVRK